MKRIGLAETIDALRGELSEAMSRGAGQRIQFPLGQVQLEFHAGVKRDVEAKGGLRFWVIELGAGENHATESIQRVTVTLEPPVDARGERVLVARGSDEKP